MSTDPRPRTGLVLPGVTVALTPVRAATSHLRKRYHERYRGKYKFPALLFGIDLFVVACVVAIFGVGVWLSLWKPQEESGLRLVFSAPPIMTATTIAFEAAVSVQDGRVHPDVRLRWVLPPGTDVASSAPQVDTQNEVLLGDLYPGEERHARLAVRLFLPPGSVRVGFQIRSGDELLSGEEVRPIVGSALRLEEKLPVVRSSGSQTLFVLHNDGNIPLDCARVRARGSLANNWDVLMAYSGFGSETYLAFDEIAPHDQRLFFLNIAESQEVRVFCGETEVARLPIIFPQSMTSSPVSDVNVSASIPGQDTIVAVTSQESLQLLVYHPLLREAEGGFRMFDVASGTTRLVLPLDVGKPLSHHGTMQPHWFVWPVRRTSDGFELLGRIYDAPITTPFSLQTEARYYAASGGQIGAGPLPPQVGQPTRYWIQWKVGPTEADLSSVEVRAKLPTGVTWTGQKALLNGGEVLQEGDELVWRLPFLPSTSADTTAAFEVSLTPTKEMRNTTPPLLEEVQAKALENRSSVMIEARTGAVDTSLPMDEQGRGKGVVR